jgi:hypothetical protein
MPHAEERSGSAWMHRFGGSPWATATWASRAVEVPVGYGQTAKLWTVVGVAGFSRLIGARMVPSRAAHDVLAGMLCVLEGFGAVPRNAVWDQEGCIGQIRRGKQVSTAELQAFRGTLGMGAILVGPNDPEAKGLVERANGYLETSFLPGRSFEDVADLNRQLSGWLKRANQRIHGTTRVRPAEAIFEDRGQLMGFPPVLPTRRCNTRPGSPGRWRAPYQSRPVSCP